MSEAHDEAQRWKRDRHKLTTRVENYMGALQEIAEDVVEVFGPAARERACRALGLDPVTRKPNTEDKP